MNKHPRRASRVPLKGAAPAAWQSQFRGTLGFDHFAPDAPVWSVCRVRGQITGVLRVQAEVQRRLSTSAGRML